MATTSGNLTKTGSTTGRMMNGSQMKMANTTGKTTTGKTVITTGMTASTTGKTMTTTGRMAIMTGKMMAITTGKTTSGTETSPTPFMTRDSLSLDPWPSSVSPKSQLWLFIVNVSLIQNTFTFTHE